jgi:outer membrane biosynthesis protein TonB
MPDRRAAAFLLVAAWLATGAPAADTKPAAPGYSAAQLLILAAPEYPKEAIQNEESGRVEVSGTVMADGSLGNPSYVTVPANAALEGAVKAVVPYWRLLPRVDRETCTFREIPAQVTIWFDLEGGKPRVSYSRPPKAASASAGSETVAIEEAPQIVSKVIPRYPRKAARNRNTPDEVKQLAYVAILPDGTVRSVVVAPMRYWADFEEEIVSSLRQWRFAPSTRLGCAEIPINFALY